MPGYLDKLLTSNTSVDLESVRDEMMTAAMNADIGHGLQAGLFARSGEDHLALKGKEEQLQSAAYTFFTTLDKLALTLYIGATSNADTSAVELEAEIGLQAAMRSWLESANAATAFPEVKDVNALATQLLHDTSARMTAAMQEVLRAQGILAPAQGSAIRQ